MIDRVLRDILSVNQCPVCSVVLIVMQMCGIIISDGVFFWGGGLIAVSFRCIFS